MPDATAETPAPVRLIVTIEADLLEGPEADPKEYPYEISEYITGAELEIYDPAHEEEGPAFVKLRVVNAEVAPAELMPADG
jgi:hypothetical protein